MKLLLNVFDRLRPTFEAGGPLSRLKPVFDATESFFFSPSLRTAESPHVRDPLDLKRFMSIVIVGLLPCAAASIYFYGLHVVAMIVVSYAVGGAVEMLFAIVRKEEINEGFLVTGLIFPLVLPPALPLWMVGVGVAFGVVVGKELFGGTGRNVFNPALVGRCFLAIGYPVAMSANWIKPGSGALGRVAQYVDASQTDAISSATPLVLMKQGALNQVHVLDLLLGTTSGSAGETSALAVVLGGLFLLATGVAAWQTVAAILGSFALLGACLHHLDPATFGQPLLHLLSGGLLFGAFFMATDPVTCPTTQEGKWAYGILIGVVTVLIRNLTGYVEGMMFAILLGNICAPLLDHVAIRIRLRRLQHEG